MSKRTESKKVAVFELEPDRFSIHTFELSKRLTMYEFQQVKGKLYQCKKTQRESGSFTRTEQGQEHIIVRHIVKRVCASH